MTEDQATDILIKYIHGKGYEPKVSIIYCQDKGSIFEFGLGKPGGLWIVWKDDGTVKDAYNTLG